MNIVLVPDSFKGTFTSLEVIQHLKDGFSKHFEDVRFTEVPIADGGEGTVDALVHALHGTLYSCEVCDPLGRKTSAKYGICGHLGVVEMAEASGITKLKKEEYNPELTSTYGVGEILMEVMKHPISEIIIGIGGSATNDGGTGMLMALGAKFYDQNGLMDRQGGCILKDIIKIDVSGIPKTLLDMPIKVMCDVTNPLTGPKGASHVYGPQKGADAKMIESLELGMVHYKTLLDHLIGDDVNQIEGAGAAGGLGAALVTVLKAQLKPGIDAILDVVGFDHLIEEADLVVTGEGKLDAQSLYGKAPIGIAKRCLGKNVKVIAVVGTEGDNAKAVYKHGIDAIVSTITGKDMGENDEVERLTEAIDTLCRILKIGMILERKIK